MQGTEVDFKDGKKRNLVLSIREAIRIERDYGNAPFDSIFQNRASINFIAACIRAGLQRRGQKEEVSMEEVEDGMAAYCKAGGSYVDYLKPIATALVEGGIMTWVTKDPQSPKAETETVDRAPSPNGGTAESPQSSAITA